MLFALESFTVFIVGLAVGSFSTALSYRVPRGMVWWGAERSVCPSCNATLRVADLIPFFSWLLSGRVCSHCKSKIHFRYPLIELSSAALALLAYFSFGFSWDLAFFMVALPFLVALFCIDLEFKILPDQLNLILFVLGFVRLFVLFPLSAVKFGILSAVIYGGGAWLLLIGGRYFLKKEALGFGDVKFFTVAGIWLGLNVLSYFMILSGAFALFFAFYWSWRFKASVFPFGPALILSFYILLVFAGSLIV